MQNNPNLYLNILNDLEGKVDKLQNDVLDIKEMIRTEISLIKVDQSKCDERWSLIGKASTWLVGLGSLSGIWAWISGQK